MDDGELIKLVERLVMLEARVAELEKRHATREVIGQVRGLEQHAVRRLDTLEGRAAALEARLAEVGRSGLLHQSFWRRVLSVAGYLLAVLFLLVLAVLLLWGLLIMASLFFVRSTGVLL